mmetsp:Transcript_8577/g.24637  ORF Transcript_8577/g.24637 Transcript_8577/m.24637 type:complete len:769 (-) Transcript_8577:204-2510(-)|eukprot:CAMPEP_0117697530 /NCGR_PEP_ID=MMETSP0804-20121206/29283_1 /TAXON_ID=1074897 /ORGANISM="Tetraselmis astigmatica, Strain CCMP880" /LENGTH=768 /DNA_ID=CAMNT_0005511797 /DNA_START=130 /DNA_END=2436 /DNA_ORIENTATION=+
MDDSFNSSSPLTFTDFLEKMKDPRAADLVRSIKAFIASFKTLDVNVELYGEKVQEFLHTADVSFRSHPLWSGSNEAELDAAGEGLEKYIMTKLYDKCFRLSAEDREGDEVLSLHMRALEFIRPEHLDIPDYFRNDAQWTLAQKELQKINSYKAPRDKLICILNCCRVITNLLNVKGSGPAGADDFFPVLVYVVIRTNPPNLRSNLEYIRRFRAASRLVSEAEYFYTNMVSAAHFVELINVDRLTIDPDVFLAHMAAAGVPMDHLAPTKPSLPASPAPTSAAATPMSSTAAASVSKQVPEGLPDMVVRRSVAELEAEGVGLLVAAEAKGELRGRHKYLYASFADLTLQDAEELLGAYKEIVLRYEALSRAVGNLHPVDLSSLLNIADPPAAPPSLAATIPGARAAPPEPPLSTISESPGALMPEAAAIQAGHSLELAFPEDASPAPVPPQSAPPTSPPLAEAAIVSPLADSSSAEPDPALPPEAEASSSPTLPPAALSEAAILRSLPSVADAIPSEAADGGRVAPPGAEQTPVVLPEDCSEAAPTPQNTSAVAAETAGLEEEEEPETRRAPFEAGLAESVGEAAEVFEEAGEGVSSLGPTLGGAEAAFATDSSNTGPAEHLPSEGCAAEVAENTLQPSEADGSLSGEGRGLFDVQPSTAPEEAGALEPVCASLPLPETDELGLVGVTAADSAQPLSVVDGNLVAPPQLGTELQAVLTDKEAAFAGVTAAASAPPGGGEAAVGSFMDVDTAAPIAVPATAAAPQQQDSLI